MKKLYVFGALLFSAVSFAQVAPTQKVGKIPSHRINTGKPVESTNPVQKALLYGPYTFGSSETWTTADNAGSGDNWVVNAVGPTGSFSSSYGTLASTTAGDGWATFDSDLLCSGNQNADIYYTETVNLSANGAVAIEFESYYTNFQGSCYVIASTDGTNWQEVPVHLDVAPNASSANPATVTANVSATLGNYSGTAYFGFRYVGGCDYAWQVDDVKIVSLPDNDLGLTTGWHGDILNDWEYSMTPLSQAREMVAGIVVENFGGVAQNNISLAWDLLKDGVSTGTTGNISVTQLPGDIDTFWVSTGYTPSANGDYSVAFTLPADDVTTNDAFETSVLTVNDHLMAHDYGATGQYGWNSASSNPDIVALANASHSWGQIYSPVNTQQVYGMDIYLGANTSTDLYLVGQVFQIDPNDQGDWIQQPLSTVLTQVELTVAAANIDAATTLTFPAPITLQAGKNYIFELNKVNSGTSGENFYVAGSEGQREDDDLACVGKGDYSATPGNVTYFNNWGQGLYIRPNFNAALAVNNLSLEGVSVFPNPTQGVITVTNTNGTNNTIEVVDVTGKVIVTKEANTTVQLDLTGNAAGIYMVTVTNEFGQMTEKVILK